MSSLIGPASIDVHGSSTAEVCSYAAPKYFLFGCREQLRYFAVTLLLRIHPAILLDGAQDASVYWHVGNQNP